MRMHLVRTLLVCLACLVSAAAPVRAARACPSGIAVATVDLAAAGGVMPGTHHHGPSGHCPTQMACCAPMAVPFAPPEAAPVRFVLTTARPLPAGDRARPDAAHPRLLRPPTSS